MPRGRRRRGNPDLMTRSAEFIGWALGGLEREIVNTRTRLAQLTEQAAQLRSRLGRRGRGTAAAVLDIAARAGAPVRKRRRLSAEARERIAEAQRRRWAKHRKAKQKSKS